MPFEGVDLVKREVPFPQRLHALHDIEQPAARFRRFASQEERPLPIGEDFFLRTDDPALHDMNLARLRDSAEQDIRPNPARAPRGCSERLSFLDDLADEEVLRHNEEIDDRERLEIVIHQEQIWIVARRQPLAFRLERPVDHPRSEFAFLALEFEFLIARGAEEIGKGAVVGERRHLRVATVRAISPGAYPSFRPCAGTLRAAGIGRLGFFEAEFHGDAMS